MSAMSGIMDRIDGLQQRRAMFGFPYAVIKRYFEDHGAWIGSLVAYYAFFSLYPLIVVFVTLATWLLNDRPDLLQRVLEAMWSKFPFADAGLTQDEIERYVAGLGGNSWILALSLLVTLWGGLGFARVLQDGVNTIWGVARFRRPRSLRRLAHSLSIVVLLGVGLIGTAIVAGVTLAADLPMGGVLLAAVANIALSVGVAVAVYRLTIATTVELRQLLPGAAIIAGATYILTLLGGLYVHNVVTRMSGLYGPFASTIGLLAYVSVLVQVFVLGTEVNVVRAKRLWPRSMTTTLTEADLRAMQLTMSREALASPGDLDDTPPTRG